VTSHKKPSRASHIHRCTKIKEARQRDQKWTDLEYCYDCVRWYVRGPEREEHCRQHLSVLPKSCGAMWHCNTLIKPVYCPFHLSATDLAVSERLRSWRGDADALRHIKDEHLRTANYPLACPLGCEGASKDERSFIYHLSDIHGYGIEKRKRQDSDMGQVKKRKTGECTTDRKSPPVGALSEEKGGKEECTTKCKLPPVVAHVVKEERGADPTLPICIDDDDDLVDPLAIVKPASTPAYAGHLLSPEETPPFSRSVSLCSSDDEDRYDFMSAYVNLPPSPASNTDIDSLDRGLGDSPDREVSLPRPEDEGPEPQPAVKTAPVAVKCNAPDTNDRGAVSPASNRSKPNAPRIRLNYKPPRIVLRLNGTPRRARQVGPKRGSRSKRRMNAKSRS
jgi:hypothetical protein